MYISNDMYGPVLRRHITLYMTMRTQHTHLVYWTAGIAGPINTILSKLRGINIDNMRHMFPNLLGIVFAIIKPSPLGESPSARTKTLPLR